MRDIDYNLHGIPGSRKFTAKKRAAYSSLYRTSLQCPKERDTPSPVPNSDSMSNKPIPQPPEERLDIALLLKEQGGLETLSEQALVPRSVKPCFDPPLQLVIARNELSSILLKWLNRLVTFCRPSVIMLEDLVARVKVLPDEEPAFSVEDVLAKETELHLSITKPDPPLFHMDAKTIVRHSIDYSRRPSPTEALNLLLVRTMTTIPVPSVRQVVMRGRDIYTVMDRIDGETLADCWPRLSWWTRLWIAVTMRGYLTQLRRLRRSVPGTPDASLCRGVMFTEDGQDPFESYQEMTDWLNSRLVHGHRIRRVPADAPRFDSAWPLVFTHHDLNLTNIMLGCDGKVYVIDWAFAGFYPLWYEHAGMHFDGGTHTRWHSWHWLVPFITGGWRGMQRHWAHIRASLIMGGIR